jgi:hypothetical protein
MLEKKIVSNFFSLQFFFFFKKKRLLGMTLFLKPSERNKCHLFSFLFLALLETNIHIVQEKYQESI